MTERFTPPNEQRHATYFIRRLIALIIVASAGCSDGSPPESPAQPAAAARTSTASPAKKVNSDNPVVRIETNQGAITVRLDGVKAPGTVRNFLNYASEGFYNNTLVHYVDAGKMILAGGYAVDGRPKPTRSPIRNEAHNGLKNVRGTIAMARDEALIDNATSQFFINIVDAPQRDHQGDAADQYGYCVFGKVIEGLDIAERISELPTTDMGGDLRQTPQPAVVISTIRVVM